MRHSVRGPAYATAFGRSRSAIETRVLLVCAVAVAGFAAPPAARAQSDTAANESRDSAPLVAVRQAPIKPKHESEITVEGLVSYGHYRIFASGTNCKVYDVGIEYDRHIWGHLLGARVDYVGEILPIVILNQPAVTDIWGGWYGSARKTIPGMEIDPMGIRWLWRDGKTIKPYLMAKGGVVGFTQKALANDGAYENFTLLSSGGVQVRLNDRYDLRLGLFGDFHFSDGFVVPANPGLDVMNATFGLTYHLGSNPRTKSH
jgi:hypothetical protein